MRIRQRRAEETLYDMRNEDTWIEHGYRCFMACIDRVWPQHNKFLVNKPRLYMYILLAKWIAR